MGRRSFIVQHRLEPIAEREIVDTDANMATRSLGDLTGEQSAEAVEPAS